MPPRRTGVKRRGGMRKNAPRRGGLRRRMPMRRRHVAEYASCKEKISLSTYVGGSPTTYAFNGNQAYNQYNVTLASTVRAKVIAQGYQFYRIKSVTLRFKPSVDTFTQGTGAPQLFYRIDKLAECRAFNSARHFEAMGCVPRRFDEKNLTVTYKPAVIISTLDNQPTGSSQWSKYLTSPWLATNKESNSPSGLWNPSEIDHQGIAWFLSVLAPTGTPAVQVPYDVEQEIEFEFKQPLVNLPPSEDFPEPVDVGTRVETEA